LIIYELKVKQIKLVKQPAPDGCLSAMEKLHRLVLPPQLGHRPLPGPVRQAGLVRVERQLRRRGFLLFKYT